jgi:DNA-binding NtrC family response regulator
MFGADLDMNAGMKFVSCMVDPNFEVDRRDPEPAAGKFSVETRKFPRHILVVDDEPLIRWSVSESLSDLGCDVEQAADAAAAVRAVTTTAASFDAVVLDLRLPDMEDLSLLATIRRLLPVARLVLMTAFGTPEIIAEAGALGASVIHKPFELEELTRLVLGSEPEAD